MVKLDDEARKRVTKAEEWKGIRAAPKVTIISEPANPHKSGEVTTESRLIHASLGVPAGTLLDHAVKRLSVKVLHNRFYCSLNDDKSGVWKGSGTEVPSLVRKLVLDIIVSVTKRNGKAGVNDIIQFCRHDRDYLGSPVDN